MTPAAILIQSYIDKIEQLQRELDEALRQRDEAREEAAWMQKEMEDEAQ